MKLIVKSHTIELEKEEIINEGEFNVQKCIFEFSQEYNLLTKYAVFSNCNGSYKILIVDNQCDMPIEILRDKETFTLGVYGYYAEDDELKIRYSPIPILISMENGSYVEDAETTVKPTPTELEQLQTQVTNNKNDIDALKEKCINYDEEVEEIKEDIIEINNNINGINQDISRLDQEQEEQNTNIQSNADAISEMNSSINDINGEIDAINNNIGVINGNIQTIENNINSIETTITGQQQEINTLNTSLEEEITNRENGDIELQEQIDGIVASSDVKDIVGTYQELLDYDTSKLGNNDIVKVLQDNTHEDAMTYYRWLTASSEFEYIGQEGPYYTKSEIDTTLLPYVKNTDYATSTNGGVIKTNATRGTAMANGTIVGSVRTSTQYENDIDNLLISKGTLENAIAGKGLTTKQYVDDNVESINQAFIDMEEVFTQSQEIQDTKINFLNTEIDNLVAILDKETSVGTNTLSYDKAKPYNVLDSKIRGNVEQKTLSGKNIWELPNNEVQNGITFTKNSDGTFNVSGTATKDAYFKTWIPIDEIENKTQYTLSSNKNVEGLEFRFEEYTTIDGSWVKQYSRIGNNQPPRNPTATVVKGTGTYARLTIFCYSGKTLNENNAKVQLEKNSEETEWEQFCGGTASPNPEFPQEVKTVNNLNLFDGNFVIGSINQNGVDVSSDSRARSSYIKIEENNNYIFSSSNKDIYYIPYFYDNNKTFISYLDGWKPQTTPFETPKNTKYVKLLVKNNSTNTITLSEIVNIQLTLPYNAIGIKRTGKNLFDKNKTVQGGWSAPNTTQRITNYIKKVYKNEKYTIQNFSSLKYAIGISTLSYPSSDNKIVNESGWQTVNSYTITANGDGYLFVQIAKQDNTALTPSILNDSDFQLEEGSQATNIEPYKEEIQYIDLDNNEVLTDDEIQIDRLGNTKLKKYWLKFTLDGTQTIQKSSSTSVENYFYQFSNVFTNKNRMYSTHLICDGTKNNNPNHSYIALNTAGTRNVLWMSFENGTFDTAQNYMNWLKDNPIDFYILCDEPQIIDLPKCEPIKTLDGVNNVDVLATLEPTYLEETYVYDLRKDVEEIKEMLINKNEVE